MVGSFPDWVSDGSETGRGSLISQTGLPLGARLWPLPLAKRARAVYTLKRDQL